LELASHGAHAQSTFLKHPFFWLSQPPLPFSLEKINKRGAKKVENQPSPNLLFKTRDDLVS
jgi:hypothetical protein